MSDDARYSTRTVCCRLETRYKGSATVERKHKIVIAIHRAGSCGVEVCDDEKVIEDTDDDEENVRGGEGSRWARIVSCALALIHCAIRPIRVTPQLEPSSCPSSSKLPSF